MAATLTPITQAQYKVTITVGSIVTDMYFTTFSGFKDQASTAQYADPQLARMHNIVGPKTLQPMTVSVPFDPDDSKHKGLLESWNKISCQVGNVLITPQRCDVNASGLGVAGDAQVAYAGTATLNLQGVRFTSLTVMNVDRSSSNVSMLELGFIADNYQFQAT